MTTQANPQQLAAIKTLVRVQQEIQSMAEVAGPENSDPRKTGVPKSA